MTSRSIFHPGNGVAVDELRQMLEDICGSAQLQPFTFDGETYYNIEADIVGETTDLVIIGAHLDSTASADPGYDDDTDDAPGADDDLSGVLGVLVAAQALKELADESTPTHTLRFVLFNAEEWNMAGSSAYADALADAEEDGGPSVRAMLQMDMIGWRPDGVPPHRFEIHGTGSDEYYKISTETALLVGLVFDLATSSSPTLAPERYPLDGCSTDPATDRSDHSSFHYHGWPACLLSEDLWTETCSAATQQGNPYYHTSQDVLAHLDLDYAVEIARCAARAAWVIAKPEEE